VKPGDLKTRAQAIVAAQAVVEARLIAERSCSQIDGELYRLELSYWRRAEELREARRKGRKG